MAATAKKVTRASPRREAVVNVRMAPLVKHLIDEAAGQLGQTRSAFMIESSRKRAEDVLLDKRLFALDANHYAAFIAALEEPPQPNEKLKRLFASKAPWEK